MFNKLTLILCRKLRAIVVFKWNQMGTKL